MPAFILAALICLGLATDVFAKPHPANLDLNIVEPDSYYCTKAEEIRVDLFLMAMTRKEREYYDSIDTMGKVDFWATITDTHGCLFILPDSAINGRP